MKKCICFGLGIMLATLSMAAEDRDYVFATAGDVDAALAERMRAGLESQTGLAVRSVPAIPVEAGQSLEAIGRAAAATLGESDHSIIVLARSGADQPQGICLPAARFGILNITRLEVGTESDQLDRRLEQEGLRVMAKLLDMARCPFPLCVLVGFEKTEDLDRMSRNFCPPCQERFRRKAREAGLRKAAPTEPAEAPAAEALGTEAPAAEALGAEAPAAETPDAESPAEDEPTDETAMDQPESDDAAAVEAPAAETPVVEPLPVETPVLKTPVAAPVAEKFPPAPKPAPAAAPKPCAAE